MISVCVATYNGERYIKEQLISILNQIGLNDELVISDDYSTDNTMQIISELNDNRVKVFMNDLRNGCSGNFENAIRNSSGEFIFLSDQDDVWFDDRVKKMMSFFENAEFVVCDAIFTDENLLTNNETFFSIRGGKKGFLNNFYKSRYLGACMAFRRTILKKALPFPNNYYLCPHDLWLTFVAEFYYKVEIVNEPLLWYRRHNSNVSTGGLKSNNTLFVKLWFRLYSFIHLIRRGI